MLARSYAIGRLARYLEPIDLLATSADDLAAWQLTLRRLSTIAHSCEVVHVAQFFTWAVYYGHVAENPAAQLVRPRVRRGLPRPIDEDDLALALENAPERIRPWLYLAAFAGLRACEVATLEARDVMTGADPPVLFVREGKGGKQRVIPLHPLVADALRRHGIPSRGYLFTREGGRGPNSPAQVSRQANDYLHGIGITAIPLRFSVPC